MQIERVYLYAFAGDILVRCPRCSQCAHLNQLLQDPRLVCGECGLVRHERLNLDMLWLQTPCCGEQLWAFNISHVDYLHRLVSAKLRERRGVVGGWSNGSLDSRLPKWILAAGNRKLVLAALDRLREMGSPG